MSKVLDAALRPVVRSTVVALALSGLMVFGGTALARLPGSHTSPSHAALKPAATMPAVKVLGKKALKMSAGQTKALLHIGKITTRALCINHGGGSLEVDIQVKSAVAGAVAVGGSGALALNGSFQTVFFATNTNPVGFANSFDVLIGATSYYHYQADFSVHAVGAACGVRLAALSD